MSFEIRIYDFDAMEAKKKGSSWEAARSGKLPDALDVVIGLARLKWGQNMAVSLYVRQSRRCSSAHTDLGGLYCNSRQRSIQEQEGAFREHAQKQWKAHRTALSANKLYASFLGRWRPDIHSDYSGWKAASALMEDAEFRRLALAADYQAATERALSLGLIDHRATADVGEMVVEGRAA